MNELLKVLKYVDWNSSATKNFPKSLLLLGPVLWKLIKLQHFVFTINLLFFFQACQELFLFFFCIERVLFPESRLNINYGLVGHSSPFWVN